MRKATRTAAKGSKAPASGRAGAGSRRVASRRVVSRRVVSPRVASHGVASRRVVSQGGEPAGSERRVARLTILIDPTKKRIFEQICTAQDLTPSQVVRRLIRQYVLENAGGRPLPGWLAGDVEPRPPEPKRAAPAKAR